MPHEPSMELLTNFVHHCIGLLANFVHHCIGLLTNFVHIAWNYQRTL